MNTSYTKYKLQITSEITSKSHEMNQFFLFYSYVLYTALYDIYGIVASGRYTPVDMNMAYISV